MSQYDSDYFSEREKTALNWIKNVGSEFVSKILQRNQVNFVLDVGCGSGLWLTELKKMGFNVVGTDISKDALRRSKQVLSDVCFLPFGTNTFDGVIILEVIEHLNSEECSKLLAEISRVCKKNGTVIISTPNGLSIGRFIYGHKWIGYTDPTHVKFYAPKNLVQLMESFNFVDLHWITNYIYPSPSPMKYVFQLPALRYLGPDTLIWGVKS